MKIIIIVIITIFFLLPDDPAIEPLPCVQGENSYYHGQTWKLNDCIDCSCSNGFTSCAKTECIPVEECEGGVEPTVREGECCVVCPGKISPDKSTAVDFTKR